MVVHGYLKGCCEDNGARLLSVVSDNVGDKSQNLQLLWALAGYGGELVPLKGGCSPGMSPG